MVFYRPRFHEVLNMAILYRKYNSWNVKMFEFFLRAKDLRIKLLAPYYRRKFGKFINKKYYIALDFDGTIVEEKIPRYRSKK